MNLGEQLKFNELPFSHRSKQASRTGNAYFMVVSKGIEVCEEVSIVPRT